jgi:polyisoprenoid-binding protein YceI
MNKYKGASFTSVYVNGNFNGWCGSCNVLTDDNKDGVWEVTLPLPQDSIEFKYTLDGWNAQESLQEGTSCTKTTSGYTNRFTKINGATTLSTVCWESCTSCASTKDKANVTFRVDVKKFGISYTNINLNGTFNSWCGACAVMTDDNKDSIYELTIPLFAGDTIEYKFTADGWSNDEKFVGGESCTKTTGNFTNRYSVISGDSTLPVVCWAKCTACTTTFNNNAVRLYPNPTTGILNIQLNQASVEVLGVAVFDVQGKQVMNVSASNNVDLSKLVDGVYFVQIKSNVGNIYKEVILNR